MRLVITLALLSICLCNEIINHKFVEQLKKKATFQVYSQEENPFRDWTREEIRNMLGTKVNRNVNMNKKVNIILNDEYDFRKEHPECILGIRDQLRCGSCWAFGATQALQNRFCLKSGGAQKIKLAPQDPVSCDYNNMGCNGGWLNLVWMYLRKKGCVDEDCLPYSAGSGYVERCPSECKSGAPFKKYKTNSIVHWTNPQQIITDVALNGPVEVGFTVYSDFMNYKGGIYEHIYGRVEGGHAVTILGYGQENEINYWICQNSWGSKWGEQGYFRIKMGQCDIESDCYAGNPVL